MPSPPMVLPADSARLSFALTGGAQIIPTRARVSAPGVDRALLRSRLDANRAGLFAVPFDPRIGFSHRLGDQVKWGGHVGWLMNGLELGYLPNGAGAAVPVVLTVGAQVNSPLLPKPLIWDARAWVSVHPRLGTWQPLLGSGISVGHRRHLLVVPEGRLASYGPDQQVPVTLRIERDETRIEGLLGLAVSMGRTTAAIAAQPFYTIAAGQPVGRPCAGGCVDGLRLDSFEAEWGTALTLTLLYDRL